MSKQTLQHYLPMSKSTKGMVESKSVVLVFVTQWNGIRSWPGLKTVIRVKSERQIIRHNHVEIQNETRYYISSLTATAKEFSQRIRGYWGVENKVHYVRDVTQGEDASRIRTKPLPQIFAIARNFTLNLYRTQMFENMAQAQRLCSFGLDTLKQLFRMK
jgi:predicted transposase YbfD/YdcC